MVSTTVSSKRLDQPHFGLANAQSISLARIEDEVGSGKIARVEFSSLLIDHARKGIRSCVLRFVGSND